MSTDNELSGAVTAYLRYGDAAFPHADTESVRAAATASDPGDLERRVVALVAEAQAVAVDWSSMTLSEAGDHARAEMARRHPGLSDAALDGLRWAFTYGWR